MMKEIWKPTHINKDFLISSMGRVLRKKYKVIDKNGREWFMKEQVMKLCDNGSGYLKVNISGENRYVHRLVARAFLGEIDKNYCVDHIDRNRHNNNVGNLRITSYSTNCINSKERKRASLYRGVYKYKKKWKCSVTRNNKEYHVGVFDTQGQAKNALNKFICDKFQQK